MEFRDCEIKCKFCGYTFIWPAGEQKQGYEYGLELDEIQPEYCEDCLDYLMRKRLRKQQGVRRPAEVPR
jgi:hypothetical protein